MRAPGWLSLLLLVLVACGESGGAADVASAPDTATLADVTVAPDVAVALDTAAVLDAVEAPDLAPDVAPDLAPLVPPYTRPAEGEPVSAEELAAVTDRYLELLEGTRWFATTEERVHGWPAADPEGRYSYGTWWSGITVTKAGDVVTFRHSPDGADNNAMRTAPLLSGALFAWTLSGRAEHAALVEEILRGFASWVMAMEREGVDTPTLVTRASYPDSVDEPRDGGTLHIDYSLNRPGEDNGACAYVHLPDNPHWGDIWVKNKRSKDDVGHMFAALPLVLEAAGEADAPFAAVRDDVATRYRDWVLEVEAADWSIATYDKDLSVYVPTDDLAHFIHVPGFVIECDAILALRLFGHGDPGEWDCGTGRNAALEGPFVVKPDNAQLIRSYHEAAIANALLARRPDLARTLLDGLAERVDEVLDGKESPTPPPHPGDEDATELVIMAGNVGLPLTWREARWIHRQIDVAHAAYLAPGNEAVYRLFEATTPDGTYSYDPPGGGIAWRYLATVLGACASPYRNPEAMPVLDCERVRAYFAAD